jgi:signal transduction histidine kinase
VTPLDRVRERWQRARRRYKSAVLRSVLIFGAWSLALLVVVTGTAVLLVLNVARDSELRDATRLTERLGAQVVTPMVDSRFRAGDPEVVAELDLALRSRMLDGQIERIKLWDEEGLVLWSDDPRLVGERFALSPAALELLEHGGSLAEVSDLDREENVLELSSGRLVEVYVGLEDADDRPLLFEVYFTTETFAEDERRLVSSVVPITVGALVLFQLGVLPLSVSLARRVDREQSERARLLQQAAVAADLERRRVAQHLHDGVIQDLAGLGYLLSGTPARRTHDERAGVDDAVRTARDVVQRDVKALRSLLTDLYPPDFEHDGLVHAVEDLAGQARHAGVGVDLDLRVYRSVPPATALLAYRVVREGLRNVLRHSSARHASVTLRADGNEIEVSVADDGCGIELDHEVLDRGSGAVPSPEGHLGLRLLRDGVRDAGGIFRLDSAPGTGTTLSVAVALPDRDCAKAF